MGDAIGSKNTCKTCWIEFFDWRTQSKKSSFSTGFANRNSQLKKVESTRPFFDCVRKLDLGFSRKRPFSTDKSDCTRNGLTANRVGILFALSGGGGFEGVLLCRSLRSFGSFVLRALSASNACFARDEPSSKRVGVVGLSRKPPKMYTFVALHSGENRQSYSRHRRCWQDDVDTALCCNCRYDTRC